MKSICGALKSAFPRVVFIDAMVAKSLGKGSVSMFSYLGECLID